MAGIRFEDIWLELTIGFIVLSVIIYKYWTKTYSYWKEHDVPYIEPTFPFGNVKENILSTRFHGFVFKDMYFKLKGHQYGGIINMRRPDLILRDPEVIKQILTKDFNYFTHRGKTFDEQKDPILAHLFNLSGDRWKLLRSKLTPTFSTGKMRMMFSLVKACGQDLQESLREHAEKQDLIELKDYMARFGTDVIGSCAFGLEINSINEPNSEFRRVTEDVFLPTISSTIRDHINSIMPGLSNIISFKSSPKARDDFFLRIVGDTVEHREKNKIKRNDFLDLLIEIKNKGHVDDDGGEENEVTNGIKSTKMSNKLNSSNDLKMTKELMTAQCFVFFLAGFETSSTTLSFCLYELALNKSIQTRLQQEIDTVLAKHNNEVSYDALKDMTYMDLVIQETLRMYSPVGTLTRECMADYKLPNSKLVIRKGTHVIVPIYGLHYDPEHYPEPERFDPDRFTDEGKKSRPNYTWLPFGEGPRVCIGIRFGIMQVKTGLINLLSKYNFDRAPETQVPITLNSAILAAPEKGIKLKISKRV